MASQDFYVHLDLNQNELQNAVIQVLASAPGSPVEGQIYYDNTGGDKKPYFYDGSSWVTMASVGTSDHGGLTGLGDDDHTQYLINVPTTSTRNRIDLASDVVGLKVQAHSSQSNPLVEFENSSAAVIASIGGDGKFFAPGGTNSLPGYSFTGDPNTGFYSDAADTVKVATNGTLRLTIGTSTIDVATMRITGVSDPTAAQDVATKAYVDATASGQDYKESVRVATTGPVTIATALNSGDVIDGVTLANGERVLVKDQSTASQNGIYIVDATPFRAPDADTSAEVTGGMTTWVNEGTVNADTAWTLATNDPIVLNTTNLTFVQTSGLGQVNAGNGLTKTGNTIDVVGTANRITVAADSVDIASNYVGQNTITTLGTITTGVWNGTTIAAANGGTGRASHTAHMPIVGGTTTTNPHQSVATGSTTGQALTYQGASAIPTFAALNLAGGANIVTGTLPVGNGGTGATTFTSNGVLLGNTTSAVTATAAGTANQVLRIAGGGGAPAFGAIDISSSAAVTGTLAATNGGTGQSTVTTGDILFGSASNVWSKLAGVATGNALISGGVATAPTWGKIALTTHVSGILPIANGGTNADGTTIGTTNQFLLYNGTRVTASGFTSASFAAASHDHDATYTKVVSQTFGDNSSTTFGITHNFNTRAVSVEVFRTASPYDTINVEVLRNTVNQVTINTNNVPTTGEYTIVIVGIDG